ncbi:hypothetical protein Avbf_06183 [Armadillidium vulgare]|nr:hypothetical protein Avbf_06183 [Armadillidium vulgare]
MDSLNELIAEGEMVIERSKKKNLDNISSSVTNSDLTDAKNYSLNESIGNNGDLTNVKNDRHNESISEFDLQELFNDSVLRTSSKVSTPCTNAAIKSFVENGRHSARLTNPSVFSVKSNSKIKKSKNVSKMQDFQQLSSDSSDTSSAEETFSQQHIQKLKEECALIFSLENSTDAEGSVLSEISSCNESCKENEEELQLSSQRIQALLAQVSESYYRSKEQEESINQIRSLSLELVGFTKELLNQHSFQHLVSEVDENRSPLRILEEVKLGLTLLLGEFPSRILHQQTIELQESQNHHRKLEQKFEALEKEFKCCNDDKVKKIVQLEIEIERKERELEEANEEIKFLQQEKEKMESKFQEELKGTEVKRNSLVEELVKVKEFQEDLRAIVKTEREKHDFLRSRLEEDVAVLKSKLRSFEEDHAKLEEKRAEKPCKACEEKSKSYASEMDQYKMKMMTAQLGQQANIDKIKELECDVEKQGVLNESLKSDISSLMEASQKKKEEFATDILYWQKKCDARGEEICERESEIRQNEVVILELQADLGLERQRNASLSSEIDLLQKQVEGLDMKMKKIIGFCPRDIRIECGLTQAKTLDESELEEKISKYLEESHRRETELKILLQEKDKEFVKLRNSLSEQIAQKNEELENLTTSIEKLEGEMGQLTTSLNISSEFFSTSCKTSSYLDSRSREIEALQEQVKKSLLAGNCSSCKINEDVVEDLREDLNEAKRLMRSAREEARRERLEAAKLKQQLAILQIDLESARELAKHSADKISVKFVNSEQDLRDSAESFTPNRRRK